ncbi:hypothetical protein KAR48_09875 [bacterium]|nr:hypothetical protein [bacterium]
MKRSIAGLMIVILFAGLLQAQQPVFTHQDTLRGSITAERVWWDLNYYHLDIKVDPVARTIGGSNTIVYRVLTSHQVMQVDLQPPLVITQIVQDGKDLDFRRDGNAWFVALTKMQKVDEVNSLVVTYKGQPQVSKQPPWSGGITWKKDSNGLDFIASTCQGDGASLWWRPARIIRLMNPTAC